METFQPKLRFSEFSGDWENYFLSDVANIITGSTPSTSNDKYYNGDKLFISPFDITGQRYILDSRIKITDLGLSKVRKIKENSILFVCIGSTIGKIGQVKGECATNQQINTLEAKSKFSNDFIYSLLELKGDGIKLLAGNQAVPQINKSDFSKFKFYFPLVEEQTKIANFLSKVDTKINQLTKKKNLLENYKKGVMQKIFNQEIRFKDDNGNDFSEWEEKSLGEVGSTYNGLTGKTKENFGVGKPYIQYKQIFDNSKIDISKFEFVDVTDNENQNKVIFGDVFFTVSSETPNEIGTASVLLDEIDELYLNSFCFGYRAKSLKILNPYFSQYLFRSESFRNEIVKLAQGSTRYNMSKVGLMKLTVKLPCENEQIKIANFLSAIDENINQITKQLQLTTQYKKGLLQQMFV
jgi:type I restriction enzyme S subunit